MAPTMKSVAEVKTLLDGEPLDLDRFLYEFGEFLDTESKLVLYSVTHGLRKSGYIGGEGDLPTWFIEAAEA